MAHVLHLYQEEHCLLDALVDFVAEGLRLDESVLVLGSTPRWDQLLERLQRSGVDARRHAVRDVNLFCACAIDSLEGHVYDGTLQALCAAHTHVRPARDEAAFEGAVSEAVDEVLEPPMVEMLQTLSAAHRPSTHMPPGQAILFWLKDNMPRTAEKVLARARARWCEQ